MNIEALKISITQRILNLNDNRILDKIATLLDTENRIGFDIDRNPASEKKYVSDIHIALNLLAAGKLETYSSEEVTSKF